MLEGNPAAPYDPAVHRERERAIFGEKTPFYGWLYPPFFLFVAAGLALMSYPIALAVWQGVSLLLYLLSIRAILRGNPASCGRVPTAQTPPNKLWLPLAVSFPAVFVNIGHGHNGFLTAALLGGGLVLLDRRSIVAGILLGLLAYKPQFGIDDPNRIIEISWLFALFWIYPQSNPQQETGNSDPARRPTQSSALSLLWGSRAAWVLISAKPDIPSQTPERPPPKSGSSSRAQFPWTAAAA